jgi:hypothetical protein
MYEDEPRLDDEFCQRRRRWSPELIAETLAIWQPILKRHLTEDDARQILENAVDAFGILLKWRREESRATDAEKDVSSP